jgi:hypothetical protein
MTPGLPLTRARVPRPIRAELLGPGRLERHAESSAAADRTSHERARGRDLLPTGERLNEQV